MKFVNKTKERIKVENEHSNPKSYSTVYPDGTIEASSDVFVKYYKDVGFTVIGEEKTERKIVTMDESKVEAVEGKAGPAKVETKVRRKKKK